MGITLVVLLLLQMLSVLILWDWGSEPFRQLVVERLVSQAPMALVGLLLMYLSSRLEDPAGSDTRTPIHWAICIISGLLAVFLTASLPIAFGGDQILQEQTDQQIAAQRGQLEMARQQSKDPAVLQQLVRQAESAGQIPAGASDAQKLQAARAFMYAGDSYKSLGKATEARGMWSLAQTKVTNDAALRTMIGDRLSAATNPPPVPPTVAKPAKGSSQYTVQVGAFSNFTNAQKQLARFRAYGSPRVVEITRSGKKLFVVRVGAYGNRADADRVAKNIGAEAKVMPMTDE
jgi:cell division protein FtsN